MSADTCDLLYSSEAAGAEQDSNKKQELRSFLERHVPDSDRKDIDKELKKTFVLKKQKEKKKKKKEVRKKRKNGKLLSARERRELGINRLPPRSNLVKYADLLPMNALWLEYIAKLVDLDRWKPGEEGFQIRLCRADYHGALVKVTKSRNPCLVGVEGLVAQETRNTFVVVGADDVTRTVPKNGSSFTFRAGPDHVFTVGGSNMTMKPAERAVKKWKNRGPMDL